MNHIHPEPCKHEISYCEKCDVVTCSKCNKEWKSYSNVAAGITQIGFGNSPLLSKNPFNNPV